MYTTVHQYFSINDSLKGRSILILYIKRKRAQPIAAK